MLTAAAPCRTAAASEKPGGRSKESEPSGRLGNRWRFENRNAGPKTGSALESAHHQGAAPCGSVPDTTSEGRPSNGNEGQQAVEPDILWPARRSSLSGYRLPERYLSYLFAPANQFHTTVTGRPSRCSTGIGTRNRFPSPLTA